MKNEIPSFIRATTLIKLMSKNSYNYSLQDLWGCLTVNVKFPVKNVGIVRKISGLALSSSQTQGFDRILKIFIKSLFFIKLEVNDDKTGLLFVPLSTLSKPEGTHHPLPLMRFLFFFPLHVAARSGLGQRTLSWSHPFLAWSETRTRRISNWWKKC